MNTVVCMQGQAVNSNFFLQTNNWKSPKKIDIKKLVSKDFVCRPSQDRLEKVYNLTLKTESGVIVSARFYDRNSDFVIIAGQGLTACKEAMVEHAELFKEYDLIIFDYRWNGKYEKFLAKSIATCSPVQKVLLNEVEEVQAVINFVKEHKKYSRVIGLGKCYSSFLFAKIQIDSVRRSGKGPFTHFIFDSCWYSLRLLAERICYDPLLPVSPQVGGASWLAKKITNNKLFKGVALGSVFGLIRDISIKRYLSLLDIPVLFIHGQYDLFIPLSHFHKMWNVSNCSSRAVLFTPYRHSDNLHDENLYYHISHKFITSSCMKEFEDKCREIIA